MLSVQHIEVVLDGPSQVERVVPAQSPQILVKLELLLPTRQRPQLLKEVGPALVKNQVPDRVESLVNEPTLSGAQGVVEDQRPAQVGGVAAEELGDEGGVLVIDGGHGQVLADGALALDVQLGARGTAAFLHGPSTLAGLDALGVAAGAVVEDLLDLLLVGLLVLLDLTSELLLLLRVGQQEVELVLVSFLEDSTGFSELVDLPVELVVVLLEVDREEVFVSADVHRAALGRGHVAFAVGAAGACASRQAPVGAHQNNQKREQDLHYYKESASRLYTPRGEL